MYHQDLIDKLSAGLAKISANRQDDPDYFAALLSEASDVFDHDVWAILFWVGDVAFPGDPVGFSLFLRSCNLDISPT